jgi:branched-chain amino acid transport system permease protein
MIGAYAAAAATEWTGSFWLGLIIALLISGLAGFIIEIVVIRRLYKRDHLDQVLATFGLILFTNELMTILFGRTPLFHNVPDVLNGSLEILPGIHYPLYRLMIIAMGLLVALTLYLVITRTKVGMLIRAGSTHRDMVAVLGVDISLMFTLLFAVGAVFAGFAGAMAGPLISVEVGMGEQQLILAFVVVVIGGIGSIRGALIGALLVGVVDTLGRAFLPDLLRVFMDQASADGIGAGVSSMSVYILMALILIFKPSGLFPIAAQSQ